MALRNFQDTIHFIFGIACAQRGPYKPNQYGKIVLPLTVFAAKFTMNAVDMTVLNINNAILLRRTVPRLPREEQDKIFSVTQRSYGKIELLIVNVGAAIIQMAQYRSALFSATVMGKIDVREYGEATDGDEDRVRINGPRLADDNLCITEVQPCDT